MLQKTLQMHALGISRISSLLSFVRNQNEDGAKQERGIRKHIAEQRISGRFARKHGDFYCLCRFGEQRQLRLQLARGQNDGGTARIGGAHHSLTELDGAV